MILYLPPTPYTHRFAPKADRAAQQAAAEREHELAAMQAAPCIA